MIPPPPWKERVWKKVNKRVLSFHGVKLCHSLWQNMEVVG